MSELSGTILLVCWLILGIVCFLSMVTHVILPKRLVPDSLIGVTIISALASLGFMVAQGVLWIWSHLCY